MTNDKTNLKELIREIQQNKILLPDFQRGFVWKEEERQKRLAASVLAKMPLGSILLLQAESKDYGCKKIGKKERIDTNSLKEHNIKILLDGQQRITVLTNIFSSTIFEGVENYQKELISTALNRRFFLRIPKYKEQEEKEDIFGIQTLSFPIKDAKTENPKFLTEDILEYIHVEYFSNVVKDAYHPKENPKKELDYFCIDSEYYYIPLYLLIESKNYVDRCNITLNRILEKITEDIVESILEEYDQKKECEQKKFLKEKINSEYCNWEEGTPKREEIRKTLIEQGKLLWKDLLVHYLRECIQNLEMHQIIVEREDRDRAIDIYENLNLGGVTLSTFDLLLAKAAKSEKESENLLDRIINYILDERKYPSELAGESMRNFYETYIDKNSYSASNELKCYLEAKHELNKKYTDAFLDVLCLLCNNSNYSKDDIKTDYIKRKAILRLDERSINHNWEKSCLGLDRACFFLQTRCGIRNINEIHYNLLFVILGYLLTNEKYFQDRNKLNILEAWYWSAILSGQFDKDQTTRTKEHLEIILETFESETGDCDWILELKNKIMDAEEFSEKCFVLMEKTPKRAKNVIKDTIKQFYLAKTYPDMLGDCPLHTLMDNREALEEHHIIPLGSVKETIKESSRNIRQKSNHIVNSAINFCYISKEANKRISSKSIGEYFEFCNSEALFELNLPEKAEDYSEKEMIRVLEERFSRVQNDIKQVVRKKLEK